MLNKIASYIADDFRASYRRSAKYHRLVGLVPQMLALIKLVASGTAEYAELQNMAAELVAKAEGAQ